MPVTEPCPSDAAPSVLVVGDVMVDIVVCTEGSVTPGADRRAMIRTRPGGSGANQAAALAAFGVRTRFAGRVGKSDHAEQTRLLQEAGVEALLGADAAMATGTLIALISPEGERSFLTDRGANARLCRADLPESLLDGVDLLHVSGYSMVDRGPRAAVLELLAAAERRSLPVTVDPGSHSFLEEIGPKNFLGWTRGASILFPNSAEAAVLAGTAERHAQLALLTGAYDLVVIKDGQEGATAARAPQSDRWAVDAVRVPVVDTSGAGDAFLAGFLSRHLRGEGIGKCLEAGVQAGSEAVSTSAARPMRATTGDGAARLHGSRRVRMRRFPCDLPE